MVTDIEEAVAEGSPIQSLPELVAKAKANPGAVSYGHAGPGSVPHLAVAAGEAWTWRTTPERAYDELWSRFRAALEPIAAELGIPGLALFLGLIGSVLLYSRRVRRRCRAVMPSTAQQLRFMELGLIAFMVTGVFGSFSRLSFLYLVVMLLWVTARACEDDFRAYRRLTAA